MIEKQIEALTTILKDQDIHKYAGDAFLDIIKAVSLGDVGALFDSSVDIKNLLFHTPTILFWDKMQRYMFGTLFLVMCTPEELDYIASFGYEEATNLTVMVSSLYQYGLFEQQEKQHGGANYVLSGFAKALKYNSLNFNEGISGNNRIVSYSQIAPLSIAEPMTWEDMDNVLMWK